MDYYKVLGVHKNSSLEEIKKRYHKLALKWHPDKNNNSTISKKKFQEISDAYQILTDKSSKFNYDNYGAVPHNFRSPNEVFKELFSTLHPVIKKFFNNTIGKISDDLLNNNYKDFWNLIDNLDKDQIIEDSSDVVKHLLKKSMTNKQETIDNNVIHNLDLDKSELEDINEININLCCLRAVTYIKLSIKKETLIQKYLLCLKHNEHILEFDGIKYTFYLKYVLPPGYEIYNTHHLILRYDLNYKYLETGFRLIYPYMDNNPLEINVNFKYNSNIVKLPDMGLLKQQNKYGNMFIIFNIIYNDDYIKEDDFKTNIPVYDNINPVELIKNIL